jgi:hypothetical protein
MTLNKKRSVFLEFLEWHMAAPIPITFQGEERNKKKRVAHDSKK